VQRASFVFGLLAVAVLSLAGCSAVPSWAQGDWVFDKDRTEQVLKGNSDNSLLGGLDSMLAGLISSQMGSMEVIITGTDETVTVNGQGHSYPFQVVSKSDSQFVLKKEDGTVETYYRDGDDMYSFGTGGAGQIKMYFKRKS
jgi:hypothetical protein